MKITVICYCSYFSKIQFSKILKKKQNWRESSGGPKIRTQGFHSSILDSIPDWGSKILQAAVMSKIRKKKKIERKMNTLTL